MMMKTITKAAFLMVEIAVDLMSIHTNVKNAYALKEEVEEAVELQYLLELQFSANLVGLLMGIVMISTTI